MTAKKPAGRVRTATNYVKARAAEPSSAAGVAAVVAAVAPMVPAPWQPWAMMLAAGAGAWAAARPDRGG